MDSESATDEISVAVRTSARPALDAAEQALKDGRRLLALQRLAAARTNLSALEYLGGLPAAARTPAGFEAEWKRLSGSADPARIGEEAAPLAGVRPAAARALGEAALAQAGVYREASLEYGRNTAPENGLFYLGAARAQSEVAEFCRSLGVESAGPEPPVRPIPGELDELETRLLLSYRPPASIERHPEFIAASGALKEARELAEAGLHHGALLRYLQAAQRFAVIAREPGTVAGTDAEIASKLESWKVRLPENRDDSVARLFVEIAEADLAARAEGKRPVQAAAIVDEVLPRYLAALGPAVNATAKALAKVTVTLVRWPYT